MHTNIKISIGIPTYNGAFRIKDTLDSIFAQLTPEVSPFLEVIVSDNASTDETSAVVDSYIKIFPCAVSYYKNEVNIGYDRNVNELFRHAVGEYVWLLADDDVVKLGAISQVLTLLFLHKTLKVVQLNFQSYDREMTKIVHEVYMPNDFLCQNAESFLSNSAGRYGQVSTLIFSRLAWNSAGVEEAFGSNYIHIFALLKVLQAGVSYIVKAPLLNVRMGSENFGISGDALVLTPLGGGKIFLQMRKMGYSKQISRRILRENRRYVFSTIPYAKNTGIARPVNLIYSLLAIHNSLELWLLWIPIIIMPTNIFRRLYGFVKYIIQIKKNTLR